MYKMWIETWGNMVPNDSPTQISYPHLMHCFAFNSITNQVINN